MNIKMVERILRDMPTIRVISAQNKDETFAGLENHQIDLIMLDLKMPELDGFELYALIREKYDTPVILMTADKSIDTIHRISELGIDDYLTKPLSPLVTKETVYGIINNRKKEI